MRSVLLGLVTAVASLAVTQLAVADPTISIGTTTASAGGTATVDLNISGLTPGTALGAFDLNIGFDPAVVSFSSALIGDPLLGGDQLDPEGFGTLSGIVPGTSTVELYDISLDDPSALTASQPTSFTLATLTYNAVASGMSSLVLSVNGLADQLGNSISSAFEDGSISVTSGGGTGVTQAPEIDPNSAAGALTLLAGCLAVLRGRRSKPKSR